MKRCVNIRENAITLFYENVIAMSRMQWVEFLNQDSNVITHKVELDTVIKMRTTISNKSKEESMNNLQDFKDMCASVIGHFDTFISKRCEENF